MAEPGPPGTMRSRFVHLHGRDEAPSQLRRLRAGPLDVALDGADLRYVRLGELELVRRVYVAVRDLNWATIAEVERETSVEAQDDGFVVRSRVRHRRGPIDFVWDGVIEGRPDATISYSLDGRCESAFEFAKIGICIHHPSRECAGRPYVATTPAGRIEGTLPLTIGPQIFDREKGYDLPLFDPYSALSIELAGGTDVSFTFEGQLFEMEDQRNWTDASFKTASTPAYLGYVHQAQPGLRIAQRVVVDCRQARRPVRAGAPARRPAKELLTLGESVGRSLPPLGFGLPTDGLGHSEHEAARVRELRAAHLRADLQAEDVEALEHALELCAGVDAALELALHVDADGLDALEALSGRMRSDSLARILVFQHGAACTPRATIEAARTYLPAGVPIVGGTNVYFCDVNRDRPDVTGLDGLAYSINSQVHAFDELSLVEALAGQADTVVSAREIFPAVPIVISPVTLRPRFNPDAVTDELTTDELELPWPVDPRQLSQFAAVWTLGSIKALSEAGAASITYYETVGWRGLFERDGGNPRPDLFPSTPGMVFPVYDVFATLREYATADLMSLVPDDPLQTTGLAFHSGSAIEAVVGNLTPEALKLTVEPCGASLELEPYGIGVVSLGRGR